VESFEISVTTVYKGVHNDQKLPAAYGAKENAIAEE